MIWLKLSMPNRMTSQRRRRKAAQPIWLRKRRSKLVVYLGAISRASLITRVALGASSAGSSLAHWLQAFNLWAHTMFHTGLRNLWKSSRRPNTQSPGLSWSSFSSLWASSERWLSSPSSSLATLRCTTRWFSRYFAPKYSSSIRTRSGASRPDLARM